MCWYMNKKSETVETILRQSTRWNKQLRKGGQVLQNNFEVRKW